MFNESDHASDRGGIDRRALEFAKLVQRALVAHQCAQLAVVARLAHDADVGRVGQGVADAAPDQRMVVTEDH